MSKSEQRVKGLSEVVLRVNDLDAMQHFYEDVIGLELMRRFPQMAFLKVAEGYNGLTQALALLDASLAPDSDVPHYQGLSPQQTTLHHFALAIELTDYEAEKQRLEHLGLTVKTMEHAWAHARSLYISDPEGNVVEFVCYDASIP